MANLITRLRSLEARIYAAACRARPVPEWATHFVDGEPGTEDLTGWEEIRR